MAIAAVLERPSSSLAAENFTARDSAPNHEYQFPVALEQRHYLSGGKILEWTGETTSVFTPFQINGAPFRVGSYPKLDAVHALEAAQNAAKAYDNGLGKWPSMSAEDRIDAVSRFCDRLSAEREKISNLIMLETAKPLDACYKEFDRTVEYIQRTLSAYRDMRREDGAEQTVKGGLVTSIERTPLGTVLCLGPFNYPLNETFTSLIPSLLMGNTAVLKPARFGVLLFEPLLEAFQESFPPGVVNVIYGDGAEVITPIMKSGKIDCLAFIGSTKISDIISGAHPEPHRLTKILGLAAHNPAIVMHGTNLDRIMPEVEAGSLTFNGQRCTTLALHYVHESLAQDYAERLAGRVEKMKSGEPWEPGVKLTALAEGEPKIRYLHELIEDAVAKGARIINERGGSVRNGIMTPAVLYPVDSSMRIYHEEQFGPIVPIVPFTDLGSVIVSISESRYGQQLSIFSDDRAGARVLAGMTRNLVSRVNINSQCQRGPDEVPFTGKKDSGLGVLSIMDALKAFSTPTVISESVPPMQ